MTSSGRKALRRLLPHSRSQIIGCLWGSPAFGLISFLAWYFDSLVFLGIGRFPSRRVANR